MSASGIEKIGGYFCSCNSLLEKVKNRYCNSKGLRSQRGSLLKDEFDTTTRIAIVEGTIYKEIQRRRKAPSRMNGKINGIVA